MSPWEWLAWGAVLLVILLVFFVLMIAIGLAAVTSLRKQQGESRRKNVVQWNYDQNSDRERDR